MPTVYLPLGSESASGTFGNLIVFQGQTARALVVPNDPRTEAQLDVRHTFHDFTKMLRTLGAWGRGYFASMIGPQWFQGLYGMARENNAARWLAADAIFQNFTSLQKAAWAAEAPFQVTYNDPGRVFFDLVKVWYTYEDSQESIFFGLPYPNGNSSADVRAWWNLGLENALTKGVYNEDYPVLDFGAGWSEVSNANATGGHYKATDSTGGRMMTFYFKGRRAKLKYLKGPSFGRLNATNGFDFNEYVDQYAAVASYGLVLDTGLMAKGLHQIIVINPDNAPCNLDEIEIADK
jgi:hypothetical protein